MMRLLTNKVFLIAVITLVLLVFMSLSLGENIVFSHVQGVVTMVISPVQKVIYMSGKWVENNILFLQEMGSLQEKNKLLADKVAQLEQENQKFADVVQENKRLREAIGLKEQFSQFDFIAANIIGKDPGNWFFVFTVDKGIKDGVKNNQPVVTSNKLVGRVLQTGVNSSKVISIIDADSTVHCRLSRSRVNVVVRGDLALKDQGLCRMDFISPEADIEVGDLVETSGLGEVFPKGILVGKVKEVRQSSREGNRYALVEPSVDFKRLEDVFIWKEK